MQISNFHRRAGSRPRRLAAFLFWLAAFAFGSGAPAADALGDDWVGDHPFRLARLGLGPDPRGREVVSVAIGDRTVGWLTPRMTERFRPAVEAAQADGRHLTAAATLEPSRRKSHESEIDVVVRVPKGWGRTDARPQ